jgi:hypothetical protein
MHTSLDFEQYRHLYSSVVGGGSTSRAAAPFDTCVLVRQSPLFLPWSKCQMPVMHALHLKLTSTMSAQSRCLYLLHAHHHRCKLARVSSSSKGFPFGCGGRALIPIGARLDSAFPIHAAWPLFLSRRQGRAARREPWAAQRHPCAA